MRILPNRQGLFVLIAEPYKKATGSYASAENGPMDIFIFSRHWSKGLPEPSFKPNGFRNHCFTPLSPKSGLQIPTWPCGNGHPWHGNNIPEKCWGSPEATGKPQPRNYCHGFV